MESTNRTILPELTRTTRADASLKLPIHWFQAGVASTKRRQSLEPVWVTGDEDGRQPRTCRMNQS